MSGTTWRWAKNNRTDENPRYSNIFFRPLQEKTFDEPPASAQRIGMRGTKGKGKGKGKSSAPKPGEEGKEEVSKVEDINR